MPSLPCPLNSNNLSVLAMGKPTHTKIQLRKQGEKLELLVPCRQRLSREAQHQIILTWCVNAAALLLIGFNIYLGAQLNSANVAEDRGLVVGVAVGLLFAIPLMVWVLGAAFKNSKEMCKQLFSKTLVSIDDRHLALSSKFWTFDWGAIRRIKVKEIRQVVMTNYQYQYLDGSDGGKAPCYLVLELDSQGTVNLFTADHRLSRAEAKWLGKEISRWVGVDFSKEA
jgi:hypothetical protein